MVKKPTVYDVAQRSGFSIATVSYSFQRPEKVKESTREAIYAAAREIGYLPSGNARSLARGKTGVLGLFSYELILEEDLEPIAGNSEDPQADNQDARTFPLYVDEVQRGFELACWHQKIAVLISGSDGDSSQGVRELAGRVDGLAIFAGDKIGHELGRLGIRVPVVAFGYEQLEDPVLRVNVDNAQGMTDLVEHLCDIHSVRSPAFIGSLVTSDFRERFSGFKDALRRRRLDVPRDPLDPTDLSSDQPFPIMRPLIEQFAREGRHNSHFPDALVCASDQLALSMIDLLRSHGVSVPGDVVVTGFDGILAGRISRPQLTTMRQPMQDMGRYAAIELAQRDGVPWDEPRLKLFETTLMIGESCGCRSLPQ